MNRMLLLLGCAFISTGAYAQSPPAIYSPWMKFCLKDASGTTCFIGRDARTACSVMVASVVFIEREGDGSATLRMTLPPAVNRDHGARIVIDQDQPISRPFKECNAQGCTAEHQAGAQDLVARLKAGRAIAAQGIDASNQPLTGRFPLAGFAEAYDGPATVPQVFEMQQSKLQEELEKRRKAAGEIRKPEGC